MTQSEPHTVVPTATKPRPALSHETKVGKVLSHPLRFEILTRLNERTYSPKELAGLTGHALGKVAYHVRVLEDLGCIELVDTAQRRGATEHYYRAIERAFLTEEDWGRLSPSARQGITQMVLRDVVDDVVSAVEAGTFGRRSDHHLSFTRLVLDDRGFAELASRTEALLADAMRIEADSVARLQEGGDGGPEVRARMTVMQYEPATGD